MIDLQRGEERGDHHVRERAVVEVVYGSVAIQLTSDAVECSAGTVVTFDRASITRCVPLPTHVYCSF